MLIKCIAPIRAAPGTNVPLGIILTNDSKTVAHLKRVEISCRYYNPFQASLKTSLNYDINESYCSYTIRQNQHCCEIFFIECRNEFTGKIIIDVRLDYNTDSDPINVFQSTFEVDINSTAIPILPDWYHGTCYTTDTRIHSVDDLAVLPGCVDK